jgi:hypothetical protein
LRLRWQLRVSGSKIFRLGFGGESGHFCAAGSEGGGKQRLDMVGSGCPLHRHDAQSGLVSSVGGSTSARWTLRNAVFSSLFRFFSRSEHVPPSPARLDLVRNLP